MKKRMIGLFYILLCCVFSCALAYIDTSADKMSNDNALTDSMNYSNTDASSILIASAEGRIPETSYPYCKLSDIDLISEGNLNGSKAAYYSAEVSYNKEEYELNDVLGLLSSEGNIITAEEDFELYTDAVPSIMTDPYMKEQWYFETIGADKVWQNVNAKGRKPGEGVVVAVIDTGVDYTHGDLKNSMWVNRTEYLGRSGVDDDKNGVIDDIYGANFSGENTGSTGRRGTSSDGNPTDTDPDGHGTHVAGIIAMTSGNGGAVGVAYGAQIMAVKAGDSQGYFKVSNVMKAINYAVQMDADVINMSFGTYGESAIIKSALEEASKECIIVAASGNDGFPNSESSLDDAKSVYPASYPFVIGVMAADKENNVTSWSNYDALPYTDDEYELAAPGYSILSTVPGDKYAYMSGTSMSAPMVSAAAAILLSEGDIPSNATPAKYVFNRLVNAGNTSAKRTEKNGNVINYPLLNIYNSLNGEQESNIELSKLTFYDYTNMKEITDDYVSKDSTKIAIECGFFLKNTGGDASDVSIEIAVDNENCVINDESEMVIGQMNSGTFLDISHDKEEAFVIILTGEKNKTYKIPVKLTVKWDGMEKVIFRELSVTFGGPEITPAPTTGTNSKNEQGNNTETVNTKPTKPTITASSSYYKIVWDNLLNAEEYVIYKAKNSKDNYKKLATVKAADGTTYYDKDISDGVKYFYRVKAVYNNRTESGYSESAYITRPAAAKKLKYSNGKLTWKKAKGASKYYIYYSKKKSSGYKKLGTSSGTSKTVPKKYRGKKIYLKVRALGTSSNGTVYGRYSSAVKIRS